MLFFIHFIISSYLSKYFKIFFADLRSKATTIIK
jgi:hypothetical protein